MPDGQQDEGAHRGPPPVAEPPASVRSVDAPARPGWPWVVYPALAAVLAVAFTGLVLWPRARDRAIAEARTDLSETARERADAIEGRVRILEGVARSVASFPSVEALVGRRAPDAPLPYDPGQGARGHLGEVLTEVRESVGLEALTVVDGAGRDLLGGGGLPAALRPVGDGPRSYLADAADGTALLVVSVPTAPDASGDHATIVAVEDAWASVGGRLGRRLRQYRTGDVWLSQRGPLGMDAFRPAPHARALVRDASHDDDAGAAFAEGGVAHGPDGRRRLVATTAIADRAWTVVAEADAGEVTDAAFRTAALTGQSLGIGLALAALGFVGLWQRRVGREAMARAAADVSLAEVLESAGDALLFIGSDGAILDARGATSDLYGWTPAQMTGMRLHQILPEAERALFDERMAETRRRGSLLFEDTHLDRHGRPFPVEINARPVDLAGRAAFLTVVRHIAARRKQEHMLARLGAALEQATEAIVITDRRGVIEYANPAFAELTGHPRDEAVGKTPRILKSGVQSQAFYVELWRRLARGEVVHTQLTNRRKDGTHYVAELTITPVRDADGEVSAYVALQHDVTRDRALDEQLRQAQRIESIGQLTGGIAHDFNNLLAIILSNATLVDDAVRGADPEARAAFEDLTAAARRGVELVRKLLAFGRRDAVDLRPLDVARAVGDTLRTVRRVIPEHIALRTDLGKTPSVRADAGSLDQILINLVTNARDAMPHGGELRISVREGRRDSDPEQVPAVDAPATKRFVELAVSDTGEGMDDVTRQRVFEPFYTTKPQGKGTGLGLAMVHGLVHQHGGSVRIESEPGVGTTVVVELPVHEGPVGRASIAAPAQALEAGGETVLFVEDEPALRRVAVRTLERLGYTVLTAGDGQEALELFEQTGADVDIVVTDVVMPTLGGVELAHAIRDVAAELPVVLVTGHATEDLGEDLEHLPGVRVVRKPWTVLELTRAIRAALGPVASAPGPRRAAAAAAARRR